MSNAIEIRSTAAQLLADSDKARAKLAALEVVRPAISAAVEFLEEEADNRSHAGSEASDYEREPRDLAERLRGALDVLQGIAA